MSGLPGTHRPQPREATGWVTVELSGALLVGERIGGKWKWECDSFPWLASTFADSLVINRCIQEFVRLAEGGQRHAHRQM